MASHAPIHLATHQLEVFEFFSHQFIDLQPYFRFQLHSTCEQHYNYAQKTYMGYIHHRARVAARWLPRTQDSVPDPVLQA